MSLLLCHSHPKTTRMRETSRLFRRLRASAPQGHRQDRSLYSHVLISVKYSFGLLVLYDAYVGLDSDELHKTHFRGSSSFIAEVLLSRSQSEICN